MADWFMSFGGHHFCMLACGVVFVSASLLGAGMIFTIEEIRSLKRNDLLQNVSLGVISLGVFAIFGAELAVGIAGLWFVGSIVGGLLSMAAIFKINGIADATV